MICRVQNDEGLVSDVEILVTVTDAESANEIGLDDFFDGPRGNITSSCILFHGLFENCLEQENGRVARRV